MAPRKQTKQAAAESVTAAADGNVSPPKKRKAVATKSSVVADEPKQTKTRVRQTKADKREPASPPKKSRAKPKKAAAAAVVVTEKNNAKSNTKSRSKKPVDKPQEETAAVDEEVVEQVIGKKTRGGGGGKSVMAKKAGTKSTTVKPKAKVSAIKKRKNEETVENGVENIENKSPVKKTTRREKAAEVSAAPAVVVVQPAKVSRKRRNAQDAKDAVVEAAGDTRVTKGTEDEEEATVPNKKRGRAKKTEANDASEVISKGKPKKSAKAVVAKPPLKETETEEQDEQNTVMQKNTSKAKVTKNAKKGKSVKKAALKGKRNTEKISDFKLDETLELEEDVKENGEAAILEISEPKQKKRNTGKTHVATNEKTELKGRQKKIQITTASADEEDGTKHTSMKNDTTEKMSPILETPNGSDISSGKNDDVLVKEENDEADKNNESMENIEAHGASDNMERSATFLCFDKTENC